VGVAALMAVRELGRSGCGLKPVESGGTEDADALAGASAFHVKPSPLYALREPISPHLAARHEGREICLERVKEWVERSAGHADFLWIETAGGVFSPLSDRHTNVDLLRATNPDNVVLVAPDRLGVLHDLKATLVAMKACGLAEPVVVLSAPAVSDASTGTNAPELLVLGTCSPTATFPRCDVRDAPTLRAAHDLLRALMHPEQRPH